MAQLGKVFQALRFSSSRNDHIKYEDNLAVNKETVEKTSYAIAVVYISYSLKENGIEEDQYLQGLHQFLPDDSNKLSTTNKDSQSSRCDFYSAFIDLCNELKEQHFAVFNDLITSLSLTEENARSVFMQISKMIYEDAINWGRIFTLYAFAGTFAVHFGKKGETELVGEIPYWIADVFQNYLSDWIIEHGGWVRCNKIFNKILSQINSKFYFFNK